VTGSDERRLRHILDQIKRIEEYVKDGRTAFETDPKTQDAVLHCLTVIGEAAGALSEESYRHLPALPQRGARGQRNIIVHEYWRIDPDIIWATIGNDLPLVAAEVTALLGPGVET
jgi:uncharacterized protein with HEPN domain